MIALNILGKKINDTSQDLYIIDCLYFQRKNIFREDDAKF